MSDNYGSAVIIAGGKGTRFSKIYKGPKPLVPFINSKRLIDIQIEKLMENGINDIHILTGYKGNEFIKWQDKWQDKVQIMLHREKVPLGSGGCLSILKKVQLSEDVVVLLGDLIFDINIKAFYKFYRKTKSDVSVLIHPNDHPYDSDIAELKGNIITEISRGKKTVANRTVAGMYIIKKELIREIKQEKKDLSKDILKKWINGKQKVTGYYSYEYVKDAGKADRFGLIKKHFIEGKMVRRKYGYKRPAIFLDRDGVINEYKGLIYKKEDIVLKDKSAEAIKKLNENDYFSIVTTNQPVVARGLCSIKELEEINGYMEYLLGKDHAYVDKVYYCPHHPDKGYEGENKKYKIDCNCRKPKIGMIEKALKEFPIDMDNSWVIGDSFRDIQMAHNANLLSVLILTGEKWKDAKKIDPLFTSVNLPDAVSMILSISNILKQLSVIPYGISSIGILGDHFSGKTFIANIIKSFILPDAYIVYPKVSQHEFFTNRQNRVKIIENGIGEFNIFIKRKFNKKEYKKILLDKGWENYNIVQTDKIDLIVKL